jgi:hypothetical protein
MNGEHSMFIDINYIISKNKNKKIKYELCWMTKVWQVLFNKMSL